MTEKPKVHNLPEERDAKAVSWPEEADGSQLHYAVGMNAYGKNDEITRIVVTRDLPGMHCDMERVRIYCGDKMIAEAPMHAIACVWY